MAGIGNPNNLRIGEVEVWLGGQLVGYTKGGVEFKVERELEELTTDQHGVAPVDIATKGNKLFVKCMLAEPTTQNIGRAIPEGDLDTGTVDDKLGIGTDAGYLLSTDAQLLRLHPRSKGATDYSEDVYLWRAVSVEAVELAFKIDEQRILEVTFQALVDVTKPDMYRLGQVGPDLIS